MTYFLIALVLNLFWEFGQSGLYETFPAFLPFWLCLALAAMIDAVITVMLLWLARKFRKPVFAVGLLGFCVAVLIEALALSLDWWSYAPAMPRLWGIGLVPVLQMMLLPPLIFYSINREKIYDF